MCIEQGTRARTYRWVVINDICILHCIRRVVSFLKVMMG